jgi:hypothetical protein
MDEEEVEEEEAPRRSKSRVPTKASSSTDGGEGQEALIRKDDN